MTRFHSSSPDHWTVPRPAQDASMRFRTHGKVQPMDTRLVSDGKVYPRELGWKIGAVVIPVLVVVAANAWVLA